ncbi:UMP-CMP kinase [Flammula alnicola]|nr:UMP-CMP kinase [Flammula alnicola]
MDLATVDQPSTSPVFDDSKVTVVFVLGGPGAGKGTQCGRLVEDFDFCHLSAGDLLRAEQNREGSQYGYIVPMEVTIKLLENAMSAALKERTTGEGWIDDQGRFLIDGFPRKMDQALKFDETVCRSSVVIYFSTTEETSGREDDNVESIKKRFRKHLKLDTMPVIEHYTAQAKVAEVDSSGSIEAVHKLASVVVNDVFAGKYGQAVVA